MSFDIFIGQDRPSGSFDIVILTSIQLVATPSWDPMIYNQNEPVAAERVLPLFLVDSVSGDPTAVTIDHTNVQIHKRGGSWVNVTNDPVALSGQTGAWELQLQQGELDTVGPFGWRVVASLVRAQISWEYVRPSQFLWKGTAQAGASGSITLDTGATATNNLYNGGTIQITNGTGVGQSRKITAYNGTTKVATVNHNWTTNPDATSVFAIYPTDMVLAISDLEPAWDAVRANHTTSGTFGEGAASVQGNVTGNVAGSVGSVTGAVGSVTGSVGSVAAAGINHAAFAQDALDSFREIRRNTATAGAAATITLDAGATAVTNLYIDHLITIVGGTGAGQTRRITAYSSGRVASVIPNWTTNPDATSVFVIHGDAQADVGMLRNSLVNSLVSGRFDSSVGAMAANVLTAAAINAAALTSAKFDNSVNIQVTRTGTAQAGAGSSITLDAGAVATDNYYSGQAIYIVSGTGVGQARAIASYVGSTKVATVNRAWATNPDAFSVFQVIPIDDFLQATDVALNQTANVTKWNGSAVSAPNIAGIPKVDITDVNGSAINNLVSGRVDASAGAIASGAINAAAIASGAIASGSFAANAINAAAIANGAIDQATFAQDALDLFQFNRRANAQAGATNSITLDAGASATDDFYDNDLLVIVGGTGSGQARAISTYVGSTKVATVSPNWAVAPDNTSVFALFSSSSTSGGGGGGPSASVIADAVWDELLSGHVISGSAGAELATAASGGGLTAGAVADAVWDELLSGHVISGSAGADLATAAIGGGLTAGAIADAVWDEAISGHLGAGSTGLNLSNASSASSPTAVAAAVWDEILTSHTTPNSAGETLQSGSSPAAIADAVWDEARGGHSTVGTFGEGIIVKSMATDSLDANALKTDAVTEIQTGLATATNLATASTNISAINTKLGTPAGASVSADIAAVVGKIGNPAGASVSADISSVKGDTSSTLAQANATAAKVNDLSKAQFGRWKIQGTQLIIYDNDETTPLHTFNLLDDTGTPSNTRIFERVPTP